MTEVPLYWIAGHLITTNFITHPVCYELSRVSVNSANAVPFILWLPKEQMTVGEEVQYHQEGGHVSDSFFVIVLKISA